jgi:deazaflavin-dependent oxidoreductase (nitroreductase family)
VRHPGTTWSERPEGGLERADHIAGAANLGRSAALSAGFPADPDDAYVVIASKGGAAQHPGWFHNLTAQPDVEIQVGRERIPVRARVAEGEERSRLWARADRVNQGQYGAYQSRTSRKIRSWCSSAEHRGVRGVHLGTIPRPGVLADGGPNEKSRQAGKHLAAPNGITTSPIPVVDETHVPALADHDMVEHSHADEIANLTQTPGDFDVLSARRRVSARMIVKKNHGGGRLADDL